MIQPKRSEKAFENPVKAKETAAGPSSLGNGKENRKWLAPAVLALSLVAACDNISKGPDVSDRADSPKASAAAPARNGDIAIAEEYDMAVSRNTVEAYRLFIDRHPRHALADKARRKMDLLLRAERDGKTDSEGAPGAK